jgi:hypothetical protein
MNLVELPTGTFTKRELERLIAYRAAVAAGFYTDQDGSADPADTNAVEAAQPADADETTDADEAAEAHPASVEAGATPESPAR